MDLQIVTKKRFIASMKKITGYLKMEWNKSVAENFAELVDKKIVLISTTKHRCNHFSKKYEKCPCRQRPSK